MKRTIALAVLCLAAASMRAQTRINLDLPPNIAATASESVEVTLDGAMLRLASKFLSDRGEDAATKAMISKLEGVYVRTYEFDDEGAYDRGVVDRVRAQLGPTWKKIVNVRSRSKDNTEIYTDMRGDAITGLVIISAEPKELVFVNIVGPIDLDKLASLEGQFGIPHFDKEKNKREKGKKEKDEKEKSHE
jgi:hypothetical protein